MNILHEIEPKPVDWQLRDCVEQFDNDGNLLVRHFGLTEKEKEDAHNAGNCVHMCGFCYDDACKWLDSQR